MEFKQIQELIKLINKSDLSELHIEQENFKITIKKEQNAEALTAVQALPVINPGAPYPVQQVAAAPQQTPEQQAAPPAPAAEKPKDDSNLIAIKSPMIGTFYRSSAPEKPAFANVGDDVAPGKVVCIIEAMKLFNEVESEVSGKIVKVLVDDASPVEYDQPLFLVEP